MCVRGFGGGGKLWATLLIFHMLHQCRSSDSVGLAFSQTQAVELSNTLSTFHWGAVHWLCQDPFFFKKKTHCGQKQIFQREHGVSNTSSWSTWNCHLYFRLRVGKRRCFRIITDENRVAQCPFNLPELCICYIDLIWNNLNRCLLEINTGHFCHASDPWMLQCSSHHMI